MTSYEKSTAKPASTENFITLPWVGSLFTILSGLSFLVLCMILPLVGKAAYVVSYYNKNFITFLVVLLVSLLLAVLAIASKMARRKIDNSPLPVFSILMAGLCTLLLLALMTGLLHI